MNAKSKILRLLTENMSDYFSDLAVRKYNIKALTIK